MQNQKNNDFYVLEVKTLEFDLKEIRLEERLEFLFGRFI